MNRPRSVVVRRHAGQRRIRRDARRRRRGFVQLGVLTLVALAVAAVLAPGPAHASTTFTPVADTYTDASSPASNFGSSTYVRADASPVRIAYLRFSVTGVGSATSAHLRIYTETSSNLGFQVYTVASTWAEGTLTANNAPPLGTLIASTGAVTSGAWKTIDVSSAVTGDGTYSFALTTADSTALRVSSRESANPAQLIVPAPGSPSPFRVRRSGATYFAESQTTSSAYSGTLKFVVESAINELGGYGGGAINFDAGTFDLGTDRFEPVEISNITFDGQGIDQTILQNTNSTAADTEPFDFKGAYGVTIRDMTICAAGPFRSTSDAIDFDKGNNSLVENVKITCSRGRGIVFDGKNAGWNSANNVVRNCVINGVPSDGIELLAASNNRVEGCVITNAAGHGIQVVKSSTGAAQPNKKSNDNVITGNTIDNSGQDGINLGSSDRNQITGNTITNSANLTAGRDGIRVSSSDGITCDDNVVSGNTATDNQAVKTQQYGLNISSALCNRTVVGADNTFTGNLAGAIRDLGTATQYPTDTEKPTPPGNLTANAVSYNRVDLAWQASTDNVGVTGYVIYRGGQQIGTVGGTTLSYQDTTVSPNTAYTYTVTAKDAAGNESLPSNQAGATTPPAPPDGEAPTPPGSLTANAVSYNRVDLAWQASTDNIGVTGYTIYRGGSEIGTVGGTTLSYQDLTVVGNTAYAYTVTARDAAGNESLPSNQASVTTPPAPSSLTFAPVADAYVNESSPTTNYGSSTSLRADASPINRSFLRFNVQGVAGTVTSAKLRIYANSSSSVGHSVQGITDTTWIESAITYASFQPALGAVVGSSGPFSAGAYIEVDVTPLVAGNGLVSLAVTTTHTTAISYGSRESANAPQLVVAFG